MKFPSQNKLWYQTGSIGANPTSPLTSGGTQGHLNLPRDLSIMNQRGYASTDTRGVPWVYRCLVEYYLQDEDQNGVSAAVGTDFSSTLDIIGCQNNWVMKNAAVKFHAARAKMFRDAGVTKKQRGAYSNEIRYTYDAYNDDWMVPIDGAGDALEVGDWDVSTIAIEDDTDIKLKLTGAAVSEASAFSATAQQIGYSYLVSRSRVPADSNLESDAVPSDFSILRTLLESRGVQDTDDEVDALAEVEGDAPPYQMITASPDLNHNITEEVLLGRALASLGAGYGSVVVDIPFGIANLKASVHDAAGTSVTSSNSICLTVTDIYPMQG